MLAARDRPTTLLPLIDHELLQPAVNQAPWRPSLAIDRHHRHAHTKLSLGGHGQRGPLYRWLPKGAAAAATSAPASNAHRPRHGHARGVRCWPVVALRSSGPSKGSAPPPAARGLAQNPAFRLSSRRRLASVLAAAASGTLKLRLKHRSCADNSPHKRPQVVPRPHSLVRRPATNSKCPLMRSRDAAVPVRKGSGEPSSPTAFTSPA